MMRIKTKTLLAVLALQLLGIAYFLFFLYLHGYLPSPFVFDKSDTFMDLFHTMYWSDNPGRYTEWKSIYPPISFLFLKLVKLALIGGIDFKDGFALRDAGLPVIIFFLGLYALIPAIVLRSKLWAEFSAFDKAIIYGIAIFCAPMLFALERGNLIVLALLFIALLLESHGFWRYLWLAILINLKPYFALLLLLFLIRRDWRGFRNGALAAGSLFVVTGILLDRNFIYMFANLLEFAGSSSLFSLHTLLALPSSISAFSVALSQEAIEQTTRYSHLLNLRAIAVALELVKWIVILWTVAELFKRRDVLSDAHILAIILVIIMNSGISVGGYSLIFYLALFPVLLRFRAVDRYIALLAGMLLPLEFAPMARSLVVDQYSYITDSIVETRWVLGLSSLLRPILNFTILLSLLQELRQDPT